MISLLFDLDSFKILTIFSISPGSKFKRNEFKEKTRLNNTPLDNVLLRLNKTKIIKKEGKLYSLDFENNYTKIIIELVSKEYKYVKEIPLEVYFLILDLIEKLKDEAYLFGSYSKLIYKENSDVDIAILGNQKKMIVINKLEKKYNKKIELHFFDKKEFYKNKSDPLIKDIIRNGIKII